MDNMSKAKSKAIAKHTMKKTHNSREYCRVCGEETSRSTRHESGHREYDHERTEHSHPLKG